MEINARTQGYYKQEEILDSFDKGDLIVTGIGFFEKLILLIVSGIRDRKFKLRARVEALESNEAKLLIRLEAAEAKLNVTPALEHTFEAVADNKILSEDKSETATPNGEDKETV